ncbi:transcription factor bHLH123 isoform X2 [Momordica charantia]|uniref:Transcription factor bHLH123 isoform X2 n=1 Tax=Momordica charantia TaxID=3673 RepID=A0A6J1DSX5_MOMCH|nr:transcription factor bHLH123 isoform X2 [Momordica charantia]
MAEEFPSSGNWWDASRSRYDAGISPSSSSVTTFPWPPPDIADVKPRSSIHDSDSDSASADPNLHFMGLGLASPPIDWNHPLLRGGEKAAESSFRSMLQQENMQETGQQQQQIQWMRSEKLFSGETPASEFKAINRGFSLDHHQAQPQQFSPPQYSSGDSAVTSFPMDTAANLYGSSATLLQGLLGGGDQQQTSPPAPALNFPYSAHFAMNSGELMPPWSASKVPPFLRNSPPKAAAPAPPHSSHLHFSNNTPFWNASDIKDVRPSFFPSYNPAPAYPDKSKNISEVRDSGTVGKKSGNDHNQQTGAAAKRPRNETPSPLPAFKVRKEKMGDRITALQQLVSPFGKTDTASVLSEAIEYIKFLHEQVSVLSTPYLKSGTAVQQQHQQQQSSEKSKEGEGGKQDLRSRGLCLVPVSSTFPVTHETTVDFWTPTFGGTFR